jgi:hypothetical protein
LRPELRDHVVKVVHLQREVLAHCRGWFALDEMDLLVPGVEPGTGEPEVRTVFSAYQPQMMNVEARCLIDVADVDRDVMDADRLHQRSLPVGRISGDAGPRCGPVGPQRGLDVCLIYAGAAHDCL